MTRWIYLKTLQKSLTCWSKVDSNIYEIQFNEITKWNGKIEIKKYLDEYVW